MADFISAASAIKTAIEISKTILNISSDVKVTEKASELNGIIISLQNNLLLLQSENSDLLKIKSELKKQLEELKTWNVEKSNHYLKQITDGVWVYVPKLSKENEKHEYWLCQNCFDNKHNKSIL